MPLKLDSVLKCGVDPVILQFYKSVAAFSSAWIALIWVPFKFSWWGVAGASIWVRDARKSTSHLEPAGVANTCPEQALPIS